MSRPTEQELLSFLEGTAGAELRASILDAVDRDPGTATRIRDAAAGLERVQSDLRDPLRAGSPTERSRPRGRRRAVSPWWIPAAVAAGVLIAVPVTFHFTASSPAAPPPLEHMATGRPASPDPSFVLILHGRWPDAADVSQSEADRRADEYWGWTSSLASEGHLVAAGDLRWEPGTRIGPEGSAVQVATTSVEQPDFVVGMFALRAATYEEAMAIAAECPHLRYGGSVSVRQVGGGFVTVPGMDDWTD